MALTYEGKGVDYRQAGMNFVISCDGEHDDTHSVCIIYMHLSGDPD